MAIDAWFALKMPAVQVFSALFCGWCARSLHQKRLINRGLTPLCSGRRYQAWAVYSLHAYLAFCIVRPSETESQRSRCSD